MGMGKIVSRSVDGGSAVFLRDATLNDSDKSFTVPSNKIWRLRYVHCDITATATAGSRNLIALVSDGTDVLFTSGRTGNIAAGQTGCLKVCMGGGLLTTSTNFVPMLSGAVPNVSLGIGFQHEFDMLAGYVIRVCDIAAIDAAADDMTVVLHYEELDV